jgi:ubiquinone biosynthesis protein
VNKREVAAYRIYRVARAVATSVPGYEALLARKWITRRDASDAAWERAHDRAARAIHDLGVDLGGLFVKAAQVAGARADVLPAPFIRRLGRFHDQVPARPFAELAPHVERELGAPLATIFASVEPEPLAAASLAQVHRARLRDGSEVVLKIQYPEAQRLFPVDLASMRRAAAIVGTLQRQIPVRELVGELTYFVGLELDFAREADATERVSKIFAGSSEVRVPYVVREYSTRRLLVLEYLDGIRITDVATLRARGVDLEVLCRQVARLFVRMIFEEEFFHGDPHPGNLLVLQDGRIGLLDHGLSKELPPGFGAGVARLLTSGFAGDAAGAADAARGIGFELDPSSAARLPELIRVLLGQSSDPSAALEAMPARVPSHMMLIFRVLILLNGLSHTLAPGRMVVQQELLRAISQLATPRALPS